MSNYIFKPPLTTQDHLEIYPFLVLNTFFFKNSSFPSVIIEWNNLDKYVRNSGSLSMFQK